MPKLNPTHLPDRLREVIDQLKRGEEVEAKKNKTLLNATQQQALEDEWNKQQVLRKKHKPPKTQAEKQKLGWKDKREVRIEIYEKAYAQLQTDLVGDFRKLQRKREAKAADAYLNGYFNAKDGVNKDSAGNIAITRARLKPPTSRFRKRDRQVNALEEQLLNQFEAEMTEEEREQRKLLKETERAEERARKGRFK
ncbi:hypothetical protein ICE94_04295 [Polynucleobacter sp. MWH-Loch1C5]|uniref:hypothetical protein n=1 Tax=Polynucleobacter sp. MWH-Loch1C5 TaxID=2689108 RepID=UPI001C0B673D|nr:hypothetical protein [Polynucleobacter sp. MWH-Loch1C5]MBU3542487.1 hypothetical protein [Polynucleobacter sp. MWH-Loch1C5]